MVLWLELNQMRILEISEIELALQLNDQLVLSSSSDVIHNFERLFMKIL